MTERAAKLWVVVCYIGMAACIWGLLSVGR